MTIASTTAGTGSNVPAAVPSGPGRADCFGAGVVDGAADGLGEMVAVAVTVGDAAAIGEAAVAVAASVDVAVTVGVAVGDVVARAVGVTVARAVGVTVGFAVGVGVEPALTTIVPVICSGWIWQKYWIVPTVWKVTWNVLPGVLIPESKTLSGAPGAREVTVCGSPEKVQRTTSPTWTDREAGWKL